MSIKSPRNKLDPPKTVPYTLRPSTVGVLGKHSMGKNIILDMDGTLITALLVGYNKYIPVARPYLKEFFQFIFNYFDNVSIWTHAEKDWFLEVYYKILVHAIPPNKTFQFVVTRENNKQISWDTPKMLSKLYTMYPNHNHLNTWIVDDTPPTYRLNVMNAVAIDPYNESNLTTDTELLRLIDLFQTSPRFM
jgi:hypothetical protein